MKPNHPVMPHPLAYLSLGAILLFSIPRTNAQEANSANHRNNAAPTNTVPPILEAEAQATGIAIGNISSAFESKELTEGDEITFLAILYEGTKVQEWLVNFRWTGEPATTRSKTVKRYASTGDVFEYSSPRYRIGSIAIGPTNGESKLNVHEDYPYVNLEFLRMGFFDTAAFYYENRLKKEKVPETPKFWFYTNRSSPVDADTVQAQVKLMEELLVDENIIRTIAASGVTCDSFLETLNSADGVSEILWAIARKPSRISMLRKGIQTSDTKGIVTKIDATDFHLPKDLSCYKYPIELSINGKKAVKLELLVTKPIGPIQQTAGVFGIDAYPSDGSNKKLSIRLIGAKSN